MSENYQSPKVRRMSTVARARGACSPGSGDAGDCNTAGNSAGSGCDSVGNSPGTFCKTVGNGD